MEALQWMQPLQAQQEAAAVALLSSKHRALASQQDGPETAGKGNKSLATAHEYTKV